MARVRLASQSIEVVVDAGLSGASLTEALRSHEPDVLVVRSTRITAEHLEASPGLSLVVRAGAGVNTIDVSTAAARGIYVANCPGKNSDAVAELTFGLILALDRHIAEGNADLRAGRWNKKKYSKASGLRGRTLGVLGMGRIGQRVCELGQAFGMEVLAWSRSLDAEAAERLGVRRYESPVEVALRSDVLSVHLAAKPETRGFIGEGIFERMKPGALFINTSRAEVVDESALLAALESPGIRAGLDVFMGEPASKEGTFEHPLAQHPRVVGSHHIGASTLQAQEAVANEVCQIIETYFERGTVPNLLNLARQSRASHVLVVRHRDRVGVLAGVLDLLRRHEINIQEMENAIFEGGLAASARIQIAGTPPDVAIRAIGALEDVLSVNLVAIRRS